MFRKTMPVARQTAQPTDTRQLTSAELALVSGGINPQPLPPLARNRAAM